jgi:hypothetical protein
MAANGALPLSTDPWHLATQAALAIRGALRDQNSFFAKTNHDENR